MKRSRITTGLLGAVLSAGLLIAPVAAADDSSSNSNSGSMSQDGPSSTASQTPTPTPTPTSDAPTTGAPTSPAGDGGTGSGTPGDKSDVGQPGAGSESQKTTPPTTPGQTSSSAPATEGSDAGTASTSPSAAPTIAGDEGMTADNVQYTDEASVISIHRSGCVLTFEVRINTAGSYTIAVWDDGKQVGTVDVSSEAGEVVTGTYTMGANVGTEAWGYDFVLKAGEAIVQMIDWNFEGSEEVMTQCAAEAVSEAPAAVTVTSKPAPGLARTGPAVGAGVLIALSLVGGGVALRRARRSA